MTHYSNLNDVPCKCLPVFGGLAVQAEINDIHVLCSLRCTSSRFFSCYLFSRVSLTFFFQSSCFLCVCKFWYPVLKKVRTSNLQGSKRTQNIKLQRHIGDSKLVFFSHRIYIIFKKIAENSNCNPSLQSEIWGIFIFLFTVWYPGKLVSALN